MKCPVCPTGIGRLGRYPKAMEPQLFERLMEEVGPYLKVVSLWGWGEPLLHPNLKGILSTARTYSFASILSTNGLNLNDGKVLQVLKDTAPPI